MSRAPGTSADTLIAADDVIKERNRQRTDERWSLAHDDAHQDGSLAAAAACYALAASYGGPFAQPYGDRRGMGLEAPPRGCISILRLLWPASWSMELWKPQDARRNLVRAGALILAEIERLDRVELAQRTAEARKVDAARKQPA